MHGDPQLINILNDKRMAFIKEPMLNTILKNNKDALFFRMWMWESHTYEDYCTVVRLQNIRDKTYLITKKLDGERMIFPVKSKIVSNDSIELSHTQIEVFENFITKVNFEGESNSQENGCFDCELFYLEIFRYRDGSPEFVLLSRNSQQNICFKLKDLILEVNGKR